ncbi:MAG: hypothetical protein Q9167_000752 [Letrouitia subvulpina]
MALNDSDMLQVLHKEGFQISLRGLRRLRKDLNLTAHISVEQKQLLRETMQTIVRQELQKGVIQGYGRRLVYDHFRQQGYNFPRDKLFSVYRTLLLDASDRRKNDLQRRRGEYIVPEPNYIWSIDGYDKLRSYGIEIYAALDTYARYVIWVHVGISNRTQTSLLSQYLYAIQAFGQQPRFIRLNRGNETSLLASAHHQLQQAYEPGLEFQDCYLYGTNTANQRIEAWWGQMTHSQLFKWRDYFTLLRQEGAFSEHQVQDQIALYAVYLPIICTEVQEFIQLWNIHQIRKQPDRPNHVAGKPYMLYFHPPAATHNFGLRLDEDVFRTLQNDISDHAQDEYLPPETLAWCTDYLQQQGFDPYHPPELSEAAATRPYQEIYLQLRERIRIHLASNTEPFLKLSERPCGGQRWSPSQDPLQNQNVREIDLNESNEDLYDSPSL